MIIKLLPKAVLSALLIMFTFDTVRELGSVIDISTITYLFYVLLSIIPLALILLAMSAVSKLGVFPEYLDDVKVTIRVLLYSVIFAVFYLWPIVVMWAILLSHSYTLSSPYFESILFTRFTLGTLCATSSTLIFNGASVIFIRRKNKNEN